MCNWQVVGVQVEQNRCKDRALRKAVTLCNKPYTHAKPNDGQPHGPSNVPLCCENCSLRNHCTSECRKPKGDQRNTSSMVCFQCNRVGHKRSQCPKLRTNGPYKTAGMQQMTYEPSGRKSAHISVMTPVERVK